MLRHDNRQQLESYCLRKLIIFHYPIDRGALFSRKVLTDALKISPSFQLKSAGIELVVGAVLCHEFVVGAAFDDAAVV